MLLFDALPCSHVLLFPQAMTQFYYKLSVRKDTASVLNNEDINRSSKYCRKKNTKYMYEDR
jgi:hypothetical protein